jgi:hypothetical protein
LSFSDAAFQPLVFTRRFPAVDIHTLLSSRRFPAVDIHTLLSSRRR